MKEQGKTSEFVAGELSVTASGLTPDPSDRRSFLLGTAGGIATLAVGMPVFAAEPAAPLFAYIGCFTTERRKAKGKGISLYRIDPGGGWTLLQTLETVPNPQFIAFDRDRKFLYSVHGDGSDVCAYAIDKASGQIRFLSKQPTAGGNSTHLTPDPTNRYLVIGNGPGVAVFPINPDGSLAPFTDMVPATGEVGPHRNQVEAGAHPHYVSFDPSGRFPVAPDRGVDRIQIYRLDGSTGKLAANGFAPTRPAPDRAISPSIRPNPGPMCATNWIPLSPPTPGIPSVANSSRSR
jgi:hypothetical protein